MPANSRLTDEWVGICCCHDDPPCPSMGGWIISGSPNAQSGNINQAIHVDTTVGYCGHTGEIVVGAPKSYTNNRAEARIGDQVTGCNIGEVILGNPTHIDS